MLRLTALAARRASTAAAPVVEDGLANALRRNAAGIQMLSPELHQQLFRGKTDRLHQNKLAESNTLLGKHGLLGRDPDTATPISFQLPPLEGGTIAAHFEAIGRRYAAPYVKLTRSLIDAPFAPAPTSWRKAAGWTEYRPGQEPRSVPFPSAAALVFDTEVLMKESRYPVMATAWSPDAWYGWVSPHLLGESSSPQLISIGTSPEPRLVVGHNVSFDRAGIAEEYALTRTSMRFADTLSLHMAVAGLTSAQRGIYKRIQKNGIDSLLDDNGGNLEWVNAGSPNSLLDVYNFHCEGSIGNEAKAARSTFVDGSSEDVLADFDNLMSYCAHDVDLTRQVLRSVWPRFVAKAPHPVTFAGMLEMGTCYLPVTEGWEGYKSRAEAAYTSVWQRVEKMLSDLALTALAEHKADSGKSDPWLSQLDWTTVEQQYTQPKFKKDGTYRKGGEPRPKTQRLPGYPAWFKDLCPERDPQPSLSLRSRAAPLLLRLQWRGFPLFFHPEHKWGYIVPAGTAHDRPARTTVLDGAYDYIPIPHKDGPEAHCGDPLAKEYMAAIADGILTSAFEGARPILEANSMCSYWVSCRSRVFAQFVVYDDHATQKPARGAILPVVLVAGTCTRRAVEPTWMTASNPKKKLVGSELKAQVVAPEGYKFVGADVDSQELWISALLGDAALGFHGATPLGWMTLQGKKSDGTDLHSKTASILGISRDNAKIFNYGRIYGAGEQYATRLLLQFNKTLTESQAKERAAELYRQTKGVRTRVFGVLGSASRRLWKDGSESYMFNRLEEIATSSEPRTPALGCSITDALHPSVVSQSYMTSRINWVVQSSGVDYLHMLLVAMNWLMDMYEIRDSRFVISIHDEVRYMTPEKEAMRIALALQISNLLTRSMFAERVGIHDLPQSVAFFSSVDVDTVLRKEVNLDCVTPSNPTPIPHGVQYDVNAILAATNGSLAEEKSI